MQRRHDVPGRRLERVPHATARTRSSARGALRRGGVLVLACASLSGPASAQTHGEPAAPSSAVEDAARALFREGNVAFDEGRYHDALWKFQSAYAAWQNPKIQLNIATTLRVLGRNAEALRAYREYARAAQPSAERQAEVEAICAELRSSVATLRLALDPGVHRVSLDGKELDRDDTPLYLDPGGHVVVSASAGGERTLQLEVQAGEVLDVAVKADVPALARRPAPPLSVRVEPAAQDSGVAVLARADIDGLGRGMVGAAGLGYPLGSRWQVAGGAFLGRTPGGWAGLELFLLETGALRPSLGVSVPVFFAGSAQVGASAEAGLRWGLSPDLFLRLRVAVVHFPSAPEGYSKTLFIPSPGLELQL